MMAAAQRNGELIADLPPERPRLREPQVVGIRGLATQIRQDCLATDLTYPDRESDAAPATASVEIVDYH